MESFFDLNPPPPALPERKIASGVIPSAADQAPVSSPSKPSTTVDERKKREQLDEYIAVCEAIKLQELRRKLLASQYEFTAYFWDVLEPDVKFRWNWHLDILSEELDEAEDTPNSKVIFNVPPGTGKSLLFVFFRARLWAKNPALRFLNASYGAHLALRDNVKLRTLIQHPRFQQLFPDVVFRGDQNVKEYFETTAGGWSVATSVGGRGTGEHPDYRFIDDPISEQQSRSKQMRSEANTWIDRTLASRGIARGARSFLIMQRLHEDDPTGHVMKRGGWKLVRFPMYYEECSCPTLFWCACGRQIATIDEIHLGPNGEWFHELGECESGQMCGPVFGRPEEELGKRCPMHTADPEWEPDPRDPRTEPGQLLMPQLIDQAAIDAMNLDPYAIAGQLQQRPSPEGGGLFKREWFKVVDAVPTVSRSKGRRVRGWDTAGTENDGDWTVGVRIFQVEIQPEQRIKKLGHEDIIVPAQYHYYIESVVRAQTADVDTLIRNTALGDGREVEQYEEKEGGSSGVAVVKSRSNSLRGFSYTAVSVSADKVTRAKPFRTQCSAGNVFLLRGEWNETYLQELTHFPTGEHDDQVDGSSCAFNGLLIGKPRQTSATWGRSH